MTEQIQENLDSQNEAAEDATTELETSTEDSQEEAHEELTEREKQFLARAKKAESKLKEYKTLKPEQPKEQPKQGEYDYGKLAVKSFLKASGITSPDEIDLAQRISKETGRAIDEVIDSRYFQVELKEMRETKATKQAMPSSNKRTGTQTRDTVDYWLAKGELPDHDIELRRKVLNAKVAREKDGSKFSTNPVIIS